ncbi:MAG TPA: ankyrin repeat domain-containing protein, partial [Candidatus Babeliaceae bacterium]|nr:ankyrin repeat domain-containing protein [Candidatus Babeliaceae bacterium]
MRLVVTALFIIAITLDQKLYAMGQRLTKSSLSSIAGSSSYDILATEIKKANYQELEQFLLENSKLLNVRDYKGYTILHNLIRDRKSWDQERRKKVLNILLSSGANSTLPIQGPKFSKDITALHYAIDEKDTDALHILLNHIKDRSFSCYLLQYLLAKCKRSIVPLSCNMIVNILLKHGAVGFCIQKDIEIVRLACHNMVNISLLNRIIEYGGWRVLSEQNSESNILKSLAKYPYIEFQKIRNIFVALLSHNAYFNTCADQEIVSKTAMLFKNELTHGSILGDFAKVMAHIDQLGSKDGDLTPLHWACARGHVDIVNLLLDHKADRNALDSNRNTPADLAARNGQVSCYLALLKAGPVVHNKHALAHSLVKRADQKGLTTLIALNKSWLEELDCNGVTPLYTSATFPGTPLIDLLCYYEANLFACDKKGVTARQQVSENPARGAACGLFQKLYAENLKVLSLSRNEEPFVAKVGEIPEICCFIADKLLPEFSEKLS